MSDQNLFFIEQKYFFIYSFMCRLWALSQNHKIVEVGRDLWRSPGPNPLLKQGHLELVAQDHIHTASEHLQAERLHNPPEQSVLAGSPSHRQNKTLSTTVKRDYEEDSWMTAMNDCESVKKMWKKNDLCFGPLAPC